MTRYDIIATSDIELEAIVTETPRLFTGKKAAGHGVTFNSITLLEELVLTSPSLGCWCNEQQILSNWMDFCPDTNVHQGRFVSSGISVPDETRHDMVMSAMRSNCRIRSLASGFLASFLIFLFDSNDLCRTVG
jgi:hypothetical protein